ncbi:protein kinase [Thermanaerothrix daxensis]|uniref:Protein kinase n=1 Tax=Thermanaerothrix daxensis TaxID=869279 RepID=A0A0N8GQC6_9CHLR|nr:serine/threonine-protein kinase [Thermanaerothrix daxensis]KPL83322.1 protein kinase [Thermanaerothrix daxensis]
MEEVALETQRITQSFSGGGANRQLPPGHVLVDRYLIQEVIGVGGMGSVYRARDLHFPNVVKIVAVKEMINQARDPMVRQTILQNFEREANLLVTLNHVAIPKIFDYFSYDERSYLVLEYINGKDLEAILNETEGFLPEDQVVKWAIEICDVLDYLHNHKPEPIIFRDMKPSNIMINHNGHVMLIDFGIAKIFREGQKGTMIGTEGYSPPEQYRGEATPLADIYALGATLHHLLTKRDPRLEPPFSFSERPIRKINPAVSPELEAVVNTALQYNPEDRFPSAAAMKEALLAVARKTGILSRITLPATMKEEKIKPLWAFKCEDEVRGSPFYDNGVIYIGSYDNNLYALDATNGDFRWKFPTEGPIVGRPIVSQDMVLIGSKDAFLYCISAKTGKLLWNHKTDGAIHSSPRVSEGHVFFGSDDGYLYAVNLTSARRAWRLDTGEAIRSTPFLTNEYIYFGTEGGEFYCVDYRGQIKWRFRAKRAITSSPTVTQGMVYFTSLDASFYALDSKSGWMIWRFRMGKGSVSSPYRVDNFVFAGSADGFIYCLDANTSKEIWRFQTDHQVSGSPIVYKDSLYCGSADGNLYCLDYKTGKLRWKFATDGPITGTPAAFNNIIYFGSADHMVYALLA